MYTCRLYPTLPQVKDQVKGRMSGFQGLASSQVLSLAWNIVMIQVRTTCLSRYTLIELCHHGDLNQLL